MVKRVRRDMVEEARPGGVDLTSRLPDECIGHIFSFIPDSADRRSCATVSKRWLHLQATMRYSDFAARPRPQWEEELSQWLYDASDITLAVLLVGASPRGALTRLSLTAGPAGISDFGLQLVSQACPGLKSLSLEHCAQVGDDGLAAIASGCRSLESLELSNSRLAGDRGLLAVAARCTNLSTLTLESCPTIGNRALAAFVNPRSRLKSLTLARCPLVGETSLVPLICTLPELGKLKLAGMRVSDAVMNAIGLRARKLGSLYLEKVWGPTEMGYSWIGAAAELEVLSLGHCVGLTARSFDGVENRFAGLKRLFIRSCPSLPDEGLVALTKSAPRLQILALQSCNGLTYSGLMQSLLNCKSTLRGLSLVCCNITGETPPFTEEPYCAQLDFIKLDKCVAVCNYWFLSWLGGACKHVKHVAVTGMGGALTDDGLLALLRPFEGGKVIKSLELNGSTGIRDRSVVAIARACRETLHSLRLQSCEGLTNECLAMIGGLCPELQELDLSWCGIRDGGVLGLAKAAPQLQALSLAGCKRITDRSLAFIEIMCCGLDMLNVRWCPKLTQRRIESVRETLFWCDLTG